MGDPPRYPSAAGFERPPPRPDRKPCGPNALRAARRRLPSRVHILTKTTIDRIVKEYATRRHFRPERPDPWGPGIVPAVTCVSRRFSRAARVILQPFVSRSTPCPGKKPATAFSAHRIRDFIRVYGRVPFSERRRRPHRRGGGRGCGYLRRVRRGVSRRSRCRGGRRGCRTAG
jgi:hypothetical protein